MHLTLVTKQDFLAFWTFSAFQVQFTQEIIRNNPLSLQYVKIV